MAHADLHEALEPAVALRRGEVWTTHSVAEGREVPHRVISNDMYNAATDISTVVVLNIDDRAIRDDPVFVRIDHPVSGQVLIDRVEYYLRGDLIRRLGCIEEKLLDQVYFKLARLLGE
jgi:mRNA-degrading endonuclease toxin of MazEF toxin-antitoxin module